MDKHRPLNMTVSKEWLERMVKAEEECGGNVSAGCFPTPPETLLDVYRRKFEEVVKRIQDPDHPDELAEDIAKILGVTLEYAE